MALGPWRAPQLHPANGDDRKAAPPHDPHRMRRGDDEPGTDYRYVRRAPGGGDGWGGGQVTTAMVSAAVAVLVLAAGWLGFVRGEIASAIGPLRDDIGELRAADARLDVEMTRELAAAVVAVRESIANLQSAHGRLDAQVTSEILRINREKVDVSTRLGMLEDINRRFAALERSVEAAQQHGHVLMQDHSKMDEAMGELRQRLRYLEQRMRVDERSGMP